MRRVHTQKTAEQRLAVFGVLAFGAFVLSFLGFAWATPGYSHMVSMISELGIHGSPHALAWNLVGFGLVGLLVLPLSWSLFKSLKPARGSAVISSLVAVSGAAWSGLGLFSASPHFAASLSTTLHFVAVGVNYLAFLAGALLFFLFLRRDAYWRPYTRVSLGALLLGVASFLVPRSIPPGLPQRLALLVYFLWILSLAVSILRKPLLAESKAAGERSRDLVGTTLEGRTHG